MSYRFALRASLDETSHSLNHRGLFLAHDPFERLSEGILQLESLFEDSGYGLAHVAACGLRRAFERLFYPGWRSKGDGLGGFR